MIRRIARNLTRGCHHLLEDAVSEGWIGLLDAISRRTDTVSELEFKRYSLYRIRGSILDFLRKQDYMSRSLRRLFKRVERFQAKFQTMYGRVADTAEVAEALGISTDDLEKRLVESSHLFRMPVDITTNHVSSSGASPETLVMNQEAGQKALDVMQDLPKNHWEVAHMIYYEAMPAQEISEVLAVSPAKVSNQHRELINLTRKRLRLT